MDYTSDSGAKRFGFFWLSFVPLLLYWGIMTGVVTVMECVIAFFASLRGQGDLLQYVGSGLVENGMIGGVFYATIGILFLGLWYYFGCRHRDFHVGRKVFRPGTVIAIFLMALAMQYLCSCVVSVAGELLPKAMESYETLMEDNGVGEITAFGILYGVILGPIAEELCFRGVTLYYAKRAFRWFWVANIFQAVLFGVMHLNLIQGLYAAFLGLFIGWVYERFHSIYASAMLHILFNLLAYGPLNTIDRLFQKTGNIYHFWPVIALVILILVIGFLVIRTRREKE